MKVSSSTAGRPSPLGSLARRIGFLRSGWYLSLALADFLRDPRQNPSTFDREFTDDSDPWSYASTAGQHRFDTAIATLDSAANGTRFNRALEVGCAEGAFTQLLEQRCNSLLAVDFSPIALERARQRRSWGAHVDFQRWDLRRDPVPGAFHLIVLMGVLEYVCRPSAIRAARDKLVGGLQPGGHLLLDNVRQNPLFETTWWGRRLVRGGVQIAATFAEHAALRRVASLTTDTHVLDLFQKVS